MRQQPISPRIAAAGRTPSTPASGKARSPRMPARSSAALAVADVDTALVVKVLRPIWTGKTETAGRLRGRIEAILDWATVEIQDGVTILRAGKGIWTICWPTRARSRQSRTIPRCLDARSRAFMAQLRKREGVAARAIEFAILTACRSGEVRRRALARNRSCRPAVDDSGRAHESGQGASGAAVHRRYGRSGCDRASARRLVFPGRTRESALSDMSLTAVLRRMGRGDITVHGFRSTFRDWCAEHEGNSFPREVCEARPGAQLARQGGSGISAWRSARQAGHAHAGVV